MSFLERWYPYAPVWAQNVGITLFGLPWRHERLGGGFERHLAGFRERDRWSPERLAVYLDGELRRLLVHAFDEVPYYRRSWRAAGIERGDLERLTTGELSRLPVTPKREVRDDPEAFVARSVARRHRLRPYRTSGSSGTPVTAFYTAEAHRRFIAAREARSFGWAGTSLRRPRAVFGGRRVVPAGIAAPPFHRYNWIERQVYLSAFHLSPGNAAEYVRALNRHRPKVLTGYAYSHYALARMIREQHLALTFTPEALVLSAEKLTGEMKSVLQEVFGARAFEEYGSAENCVLATECEHGRLHAHPDFGILELADDQGRPVPPGADGRILGTGLLNEAQPLIRYELGDVGVWSGAACPCGRAHLPVLEEIVGRLDDALIGPDGREVARFSTVFKGLRVQECQVIQESLTRLVVNVVAGPGYGAEDANQIRRRVTAQMGPVTVSIQPVGEIPRTERGKFRAVICRLPARERPGWAAAPHSLAGTDCGRSR